MKRNLVRTVLMASGMAALAASTAITVAVIRGRNTGTVIVSNVLELKNAIKKAPDCDTIVLSRVGSPYNLSEQPAMGRTGYIVLENGITLRGETGRPEDIVLIGVSNRILHVKAQGCRIENMTFRGGNCTTNMLGISNRAGTNVWGGAVYLGLQSNECRIVNCIFTNNAALRGGAIAMSKEKDPTTRIVGCRFIGNEAEEHGGACYNAGTMYNCLFLENKATKNGGAAYNSVVLQATSERNKATKGSEFCECDIARMSYIGETEEKSSRFHNVTMDRCKITATNGIVFSGFFNVRNSLVSEGEDIVLAKNLEYNGEKEPRILCSTIVSNIGYRLISPPANFEPGMSASLIISNCLIYGNSMTGIKVNKVAATNGTYKTIELTKGQRLVALGWDGHFPERGITNYYESYDISQYPEGWSITVDSEKLDQTYDTVETVVPQGYVRETFSITWQQYYYALGWDGIDKMTFKAKYMKIPLPHLSINLLNSLSDTISTNLTWGEYYEGLGWNGIDDYIGSNPYDIVEKDLQYLKMANSIAGIKGEKPSTFNNVYVYNRASFNPRFAMSADVNNPYSIDKSSLACHLSFGNIISQIPIENWMINSKDLRGSPRTYGGGLDIGAYQAAVFYPFVMFIR